MTIISKRYEKHHEFAIKFRNSPSSVLQRDLFPNPHRQVAKDRSENAIKSIQWLRGKEYDYEPELAELRENDRETKANKVNVWAALNRPVTRKALAISMGLMFFQQVCGINAVIFYASRIFMVSLRPLRLPIF